VGLMAVGLSSNYIVEQSSTSRNLFGLLFTGFFITVGVIGLLIARTITNPIERLVNTTRAIRDGDFSRRVQLAPRDELGELGISFDMMTEQLVTRNEEVVNLLHQQVAETAQREAVLTSISDAVIVQDTSGQIILQNQTAQQLMNSIAANRQQRERFMNFLNKPQELRRPQIVTLADHHFSVLSTPVMMEQDGLLGHVIVFRDITAIIETEHLKDELVLQMSHELRTPLGVVRGYVDLVKLMGANNMSADEVKYVEGAREGLSTLERLVNQVVDVSAILSSRFNIEPETFNLAYLIGDVFTNWQPAMKQRNLQFSLMLATNDLFIEADPARIEQLLEHILRNAHSYTLPGGLVEICAESNETTAFISITDSGKGIAPDEINRVFERMYRGRASMAGDTDARGMGLGLYISQQIVEAHHGTIKIESAIDLGTIVTIELPIRQP
jgi:signal transduction histidine kinase